MQIAKRFSVTFVPRRRSGHGVGLGPGADRVAVYNGNNIKHLCLRVYMFMFITNFFSLHFLCCRKNIYNCCDDMGLHKTWTIYHCNFAQDVRTIKEESGVENVPNRPEFLGRGSNYFHGAMCYFPWVMIFFILEESFYSIYLRRHTFQTSENSQNFK